METQQEAARGHRVREWIARRKTALGASALGLVLVAGTGWQTCIFAGCPAVSGLRDWVPEEASILLDAEGREVARLFLKSRNAVAIETLPAYVPEAFIAMEDRRFETHHGVDWTRFTGAMVSNLRSMGVREGGSTITMQLARNLYPDRLPPTSHNPLRKLREMRVAQLIEREIGKRKILEIYLNEIYFGEGAYGVDAAAVEYFGHPSSELTLGEAAMLASLPRAPARYNPRKSAETAQQGRDVVLGRMAAENYITAAELQSVRGEAISVVESRPRNRIAPWFVEEVRKQMQDELGMALYTGGYRIHTTLDTAAQASLAQELERQAVAVESGRLGRYRGGKDERLQYAGVILSPQNGDVLAMVGGRDFEESRFNRATQAKRQPGSAFKPIVYAAALTSGRSPVELLSDEPFGVTAADGEIWSPRNASGNYGDAVTMREALSQSRNSATVRLAHETGITRVAQLAERLDIAANVPAWSSMPLGTVETTPMALTAAFATFASQGGRPIPRLVTHLEDRNGHIIHTYAERTVPVLDPAVAFIVTDLMRGVVDGGTGWRVRQAGFYGMAAGKTGTTQEGADLWFAGITPNLAATIWFGFDRRHAVISGGSGGAVAAPVWGRVMARIAAEDNSRWTPPPGVESVLVDEYGTILSEDCPYVGDARTEWVVAGALMPERSCPDLPGLRGSLPGRLMRFLGRAIRGKGND